MFVVAGVAWGGEDAGGVEFVDGLEAIGRLLDADSLLDGELDGAQAVADGHDAFGAEVDVLEIIR